MRSRRRRPASLLAPIVHTEHLEERTLLDASGAMADAAGFNYFESKEELSEHLVQQALERHEDQFDQPTWGGWWRGGIGEPLAAGSGGVDLFSLAAESSDTNTQVDGVDEADIIENDGEHLYLIQEGAIVIVDADQPEEMSIVASIKVDGIQSQCFFTNAL